MTSWLILAMFTCAVILAGSAIGTAVAGIRERVDITVYLHVYAYTTIAHTIHFRPVYC